MRTIARTALLPLVAASLCRPAGACGPGYYYSPWEEKDFPKATELEFNDLVRTEVGLTQDEQLPKAVQPGESQTHLTHAEECDVQDLDERLADVPAESRQRIVAAYKSVRQDLSLKNADGTLKAPVETSTKKLAEMEKEVPAEFRLYAQGAAHYYAGDNDSARKAWTELMALPESERRYRSMWAAYMLAALPEVKDEPKPSGDFTDLKALKDKGFKDRCGLYQRSRFHAWRALRERGQAVDALLAVADTMSVGYQITSLDLRRTISDALGASEADVRRIAHAPVALGLVAAYLVADFRIDVDYFTGGHSYENDAQDPKLPALLDEIAKTKDLVMPKAPNLAWLAYKQGRDAEARRFLAVADKKNPLAAWVEARLQLKEGQSKPAYDTLMRQSYALETSYFKAAAGPKFPTVTASLEPIGYRGVVRHLYRGITREAANIALRDKRFKEATIQYLRSGYDDIAMYLLERVLTLDEARFVVDKALPPMVKPLPVPGEADKQRAVCDLAPQRDYWGDGKPDCAPLESNLRAALARRYFRKGDFKQAAVYFDEAGKARLARYLELVAATKAPVKKGDAAGAAKLRELAMLLAEGSLNATQTEPDYPDLSERGIREDYGYRSYLLTRNKATWSTKEEFVRVKDSRTKPDTKRHYLYNASEVAWQASLAMPDQADETAKLLYETGLWFKYLDPAHAERFYKALVRRCGTTEVGANAKKRGWL